MMNRRTFVASAVPCAAWASRPKMFRYSEVEARIARRDFSGITKDDLPTPSLCVEKTIFEKNLEAMFAHCKSAGIGLRAHCKIHKSPVIAKKQMAMGSLGICCATIAEAELMVKHGIKGVLYTCQPAGKNKIWRTVALAQREPTFMAVADDPLTVDLLEEACAAAGTKMTVLADLYAGLTRAGHATGQPGVELATRIDRQKNLKLGGIMGYSGAASHTRGWEARRLKSIKDVQPVVETALAVRKAGMPAPVITGGSTGTYNIDKEIGLTELQAGSFVFMDTLYAGVGGKGNDARYTDFDIALTVLTTVISRNHPNQATIDAGNKAMLRPTDQVKSRPGMIVENQGAEYGILRWTGGDELKLGQRVELYTSNLDMTTNCYDRYYVCEGDRLVDVWPIMDRAGAVQR